MSHGGSMIIGAYVTAFGWSPAGWLDHASPVDAATNLKHLLDVTRTAEDAKLDFVFFADVPGATGAPEVMARNPTTLNRFEPLTLISALAAGTSRIGLAATVSTTFTEPFNTARAFASIDHLSGGRACWNVVTSDADETAANFGLAHLPDRDLRYSRASEFVDVAVGLWDSFDEDALVLDRSSGIYADMDKIHTLGHEGEHFSVRGPLNLERSPQGRPIIAQAGGSPAGIDLAGRTADIVFAISPDKARAMEITTAIKDAAEGHGRRRDDVKVLAGLIVNTGRTREEAEAHLRELTDSVHHVVGRAQLGEFLEADLTGLDLDLPVPEDRLPAGARGSRALFEAVADLVRRGMTLRELISFYVEKSVGNGVTGSYLEIADQLDDWFVSGACDGYIIMNQTIPASLEAFTSLVVPELQRRGLFRSDYEGTTLREHLGLRAPQPLPPALAV